MKKHERISALIGILLVALLATQCFAGEPAVTIEIVGADGDVIVRKQAETLTFDREYKKGDLIRVTGPKHMVIRLDENIPETIVYAPKGSIEYPVPAPRERAGHPSKSFSGSRHTVTARAASATEISKHRNVALNPFDLTGSTTCFPHASTSSSYKDMPAYVARNVIDGMSKNTRHSGWPYQSWGPHRREDLWLKVDFGRPVEIDKMVLVIRADFPHDRHWHSAVLEFSDGSREAIKIEKKGKPQTFTFKKRTASWMRFTKLVQAKPLGWCAFVEVEVWGKDEPDAK